MPPTMPLAKSLRRRFPFPIAVSFALLTLMVLGGFALAVLLTLNSIRTSAVAEYRRDATDLLSAMRDVETGQRGYLLTQRDAYLAPYTTALKSVGPVLDKMARVLPERSAETVPALRRVVAAKLAELAQTVELQRAGKHDEALKIVGTDRGKALMDGIRAIVDRERVWAQQRTQKLVGISTFELGVLIWGLAACAVAIVLLSLLWLRDERRQLAEIDGARGEAIDALAALKTEIMAREVAENRVRQLQKIESLGQLTGGIAHDFNNMLAVVMGGIELAKRRLRTDPDKADALLDNAREGATRAATLTARLLAFSRNQPLAPAPLDVNKLVGGMCEMLNRTLGETVEVECVYAAGLWRCYADPGEVENAVLNLAINARDAMPGGGKLTVETANAHIDDNYARTRTDVLAGQYVLVCVSDTGTGMPQDVIERAFDPFFTTKPVGRGTGLGLSQVFGFVKQSGGHVAIYSELGQGTTIKLYLPRYTGTEQGMSLAATTEETPSGNASEIILVVEDEQRLRHYAVDALRELGYTALSAGSPVEALKILSEQPQITMLFTDIVMPEMTGRELADHARELRQELKILFTTGYTRNAVVHGGMIDIGVAFLAKPYTMGDLARKVRAVLDGDGVNRKV